MSLGGQQLALGAAANSAFLTDGVTGWALSGNYLWKYSSSWSSVAWGELPYSDYPIFDECYDIAAPNSSTEALACFSSSSFQIGYLGVSQF